MLVGIGRGEDIFDLPDQSCHSTAEEKRETDLEIPMK
jgi:hypothetical protein